MKTWGFARGFYNEGKDENAKQVDELIAAGAEQVVFEYQQFNSKAKQPFPRLLAMTQPGDTIVARDASRMSSGAYEFCEHLKTIREKQLRLVLLDGITADFRQDPADTQSKAYSQLAQMLSDLEVSKYYKKTQFTVSGGKMFRKKLGRPSTTVNDIPPIFYSHYVMIHDGQLNISEAARLCRLSRPTIYKYMRILDKELENIEYINPHAEGVMK